MVLNETRKSYNIWQQWGVELKEEFMCLTGFFHRVVSVGKLCGVPRLGAVVCVFFGFFFSRTGRPERSCGSFFGQRSATSYAKGIEDVFSVQFGGKDTCVCGRGAHQVAHSSPNFEGWSSSCSLSLYKWINLHMHLFAYPLIYLFISLFIEWERERESAQWQSRAVSYVKRKMDFAEGGLICSASTLPRYTSVVRRIHAFRL